MNNHWLVFVAGCMRPAAASLSCLVWIHCFLTWCQCVLGPETWKRGGKCLGTSPVSQGEAGFTPCVSQVPQLLSGRSARDTHCFIFLNRFLWCFYQDFCASVNYFHSNYSFSSIDRLFAPLDRICWWAVRAQFQDILWWLFPQAFFSVRYRVAQSIYQPTFEGWRLQCNGYIPVAWAAADRVRALPLNLPSFSRLVSWSKFSFLVCLS